MIKVKKITPEIIKNFCEKLKNGKATCCHFVVYTEEDTGREWSIAIGLDSNDDIVGKVAYQNHNNAMCTDLDFDFRMPCYKNGEVADTQTTIWDKPFNGSPNYSLEAKDFNSEAQRIVNEFANKVEDPKAEVALSSTKTIAVDISDSYVGAEDFLGSTNAKEYSWLLQGMNKDSIDNLYDVIDNQDNDIDSNSFRNIMQVNFDDELPEEALTIIDEEFRVLKKQNNIELQKQLDSLEQIFRKEGLSITGDMGLAFQDSDTIPGYVDHFCVTFNEDTEDEKAYCICCADGKFSISDYDDDNFSEDLKSFEQAKKECADIIAKNKSKVVSCTHRIFAFVDSILRRLDSKTIEAYQHLNERFYDYHGKLNKEELTNSIITEIETRQGFYDRLLNKKQKITSICWDALSNVFRNYLEWCESKKTDLSSEQIKNWFKANDTTYQEVLKDTLKEIQKLRDTYLKEQEDFKKKNL